MMGVSVGNGLVDFSEGMFSVFLGVLGGVVVESLHVIFVLDIDGLGIIVLAVSYLFFDDLADHLRKSDHLVIEDSSDFVDFDCVIGGMQTFAPDCRVPPLLLQHFFFPEEGEGVDNTYLNYLPERHIVVDEL